MEVKPLARRMDDKGPLAIAVTVDAGQIVVDFGKAVHWFAIPPEEARRFALMRLRRGKFLQLLPDGSVRVNMPDK